eukprot:CAMPEP_0178413312 /NCGR_PEP_ID=MMETSP0689_2-20121128/22464_1 /TAXON_ID=160604 /ORGANISM="Amphidinium massartii, Strain CS-259" /LENGTH=380 /DNA_ID=CAMNT_0020034583 /DNA_START=20 /DNA_END=1162 /DNA_ORIENTATION=+
MTRDDLEEVLEAFRSGERELQLYWPQNAQAQLQIRGPAAQQLLSRLTREAAVWSRLQHDEQVSLRRLRLFSVPSDIVVAIAEGLQAEEGVMVEISGWPDDEAEAFAVDSMIQALERGVWCQLHLCTGRQALSNLARVESEQQAVEALRNPHFKTADWAAPTVEIFPVHPWGGGREYACVTGLGPRGPEDLRILLQPWLAKEAILECFLIEPAEDIVGGLRMWRYIDSAATSAEVAFLICGLHDVQVLEQMLTRCKAKHLDLRLRLKLTVTWQCTSLRLLDLIMQQRRNQHRGILAALQVEVDVDFRVTDAGDPAEGTGVLDVARDLLQHHAASPFTKLTVRDRSAHSLLRLVLMDQLGDIPNVCRIIQQGCILSAYFEHR